jgi:hypothetical protein
MIMQATETTKAHGCLLTLSVLFWGLFVDLVARCGPGCTDADWTPVVFRMGARECLVDAGVDIALWLAANCCQLGNHKIARTFEHPLFAE